MKIITLSREYGAGGHTIGKTVAEKLGIEIYDKDIIRETAKASGLDESFIADKEETLSKGDSFLRSITPISYEQKDVIFEIEKEVILKLAAKGPCVIIGRCADVILREAGFDTLDVFLYANEEKRAARVGELIGTKNPAAIKKAMKNVDYSRHAYYKYYTDKQWGDFNNYNLMLDTGSLGTDLCIELICAAAKAE